jgi:hypothetical protein
LHDFIEKKREMFLVQYALGVKRDEMRKLEEIAQVSLKIIRINFFLGRRTKAFG